MMGLEYSHMDIFKQRGGLTVGESDGELAGSNC